MAEVIIFSDVDFCGASRSLAIGRYFVEHLTIGAAAPRSLRVPDGMEVVLHKRPRAGGGAVTLTSDTDDLGDVKRELSSLEVRERPAGLAAQQGRTSRRSPRRGAARSSPLPEVSFEMFTRSFTLPIDFAGSVDETPIDGATRYTGPVTLDAPFHVSVDPLELTVKDGDPLRYVLKFTMPGGLGDLMTQEIAPAVPGEVWTVIDTLIMPFVEAFESAVVIIANEGGHDDQWGDYVDGVTLFTQVSAGSFQPFKALQSTFPALGLDERDVVLKIAASSGAELSFQVQAALELDVALGTDAVVFRSLAVQVDQQADSISAGVTATFELHIGNEVLELRGGIKGEIAEGADVVVWGALSANDGAWENPFGFQGVTITGFGVQLGPIPTPPFVSIGAYGGVIIGDGLADAKIALLIDTSQPQDTILRIESAEGIDLPRLLDALTSDAIDASGLIDVAIKNLLIHIAPNGGTIAEETYEPGLAIHGTLDLWGWGAQLAGKIDFAGGGSLQGLLDPISLSGGGVEFLSITNASVTVEVGEDGVSSTLAGEISLMSLTQPFTAEISSSGFSIDLSGGTFFETARVDLHEGLFAIDLAVSFSVNVDIVGHSVGLSVACAAKVEISDDSFSQDVRFSFDILGGSYDVPVVVTETITSLESLQNAFLAWFDAEFSQTVLDVLREAGEAVFKWVQENITAAVDEAAKFFQDAGAASADIAQGLVGTYGVSPEEAVKALGVGAEEAAALLKDTFNKSAAEVGEFLNSTGQYTSEAINDVLLGAGYAADEVSDAMESIFGDDWPPFIDTPFIDTPFIDTPFIDTPFIDTPFIDTPFFDNPF